MVWSETGHSPLHWLSPDLKTKTRRVFQNVIVDDFMAIWQKNLEKQGHSGHCSCLDSRNQSWKETGSQKYRKAEKTGFGFRDGTEAKGSTGNQRGHPAPQQALILCASRHLGGVADAKETTHNAARALTLGNPICSKYEGGSLHSSSRFNSHLSKNANMTCQEMKTT